MVHICYIFSVSDEGLILCVQKTAHEPLGLTAAFVCSFQSDPEGIVKPLAKVQPFQVAEVNYIKVGAFLAKVQLFLNRQGIYMLSFFVDIRILQMAREG